LSLRFTDTAAIESLDYLYRDRFSLISLICVVLFVALMLSGSNQFSRSEEIAAITASSYSQEGEQSIIGQSQFANLGFTKDSLEFDIVYANIDFLRRQRYLSVGPSYTDYIQVKHFDAWNNQIKVEWKGDRVAHSPSKRWDFDFGSYVFEVPSNASRSTLMLSGTGNLRAHVNVLNQSELIRMTFHSAGIQYFVLALLFFGAMASLSFGTFTRDGMLVTVGYYLSAWSILLLGLSNLVRVYYPETNQLSDYFVSLGALSATGLGAYTHARIIEYGTRSKVLSLTLRAVSLASIVLIAAYVFGFQRVALQSNIIMISIIPLIMVIGVLIVKPRNRIVGIFWRRIRVFYAGLFVIVSVTAVSGLGVGNQLSLTYFHALLTMAVLMFLMLTRSFLERRFYVRSQIRNRTLKQAKILLEDQLQDQRSFVSMLTHEIKTPLTTLKLMTRKLAQSDGVGAQISHIDHVVDQTRMLEMMVTGSTTEREVDLQNLVLAEINRLSKTIENPAEVVFRWRGQTLMQSDPVVITTIIRNLLENANKYRTPNTRIFLSIFDVRGYLGLRIRNQTLYPISDSAAVFEKYWRSDRVTGIRGTGLGLWILKRICRANGYQIKCKMIDDQFVIEVVFRTEY
jgi:signal transduction histidine kinase